MGTDNDTRGCSVKLKNGPGLDVTADSPGPAPQMPTMSPLPTSGSSLACQAVGRMSDRKMTWLSDRLSLAMGSRLVLAARRAGPLC